MLLKKSNLVNSCHLHQSSTSVGSMIVVDLPSRSSAMITKMYNKFVNYIISTRSFSPTDYISVIEKIKKLKTRKRGVLTPTPSLRYFGITLREPRTIQIIHPTPDAYTLVSHQGTPDQAVLSGHLRTDRL